MAQTTNQSTSKNFPQRALGPFLGGVLGAVCTLLALGASLSIWKAHHSLKGKAGERDQQSHHSLDPEYQNVQPGLFYLAPPSE